MNSAAMTLEFDPNQVQQLPTDEELLKLIVPHLSWWIYAATVWGASQFCKNTRMRSPTHSVFKQE
jgi:hypothetical protein